MSQPFFSAEWFRICWFIVELRTERPLAVVLDGIIDEFVEFPIRPRRNTTLIPFLDSVVRLGFRQPKVMCENRANIEGPIVAPLALNGRLDPPKVVSSLLDRIIP